jgi:hypothetical protein
MAAENTSGEKRWVNYLRGLPSSQSKMREEVSAFSSRIRTLGIRCLKCDKIHEFGNILSQCPNCSSTQYTAENITAAQMTINCNRCAAVVMKSVKCDCGCVTPLNYRQLLKEAQPEKAGMCFVATAACGDPFATEVLLLSAFRDDILSRSRIGTAFVSLYYTLSPPVASVIAQSKMLRRAAMVMIVKPATSLVRLMWDRYY